MFRGLRGFKVWGRGDRGGGGCVEGFGEEQASQGMLWIAG